MQIHITNDNGDFHTLEVDGTLELENLKALVEAETSIPAAQQILRHNGAELTDMKKTLSALGVRQDDMLLLQQKSTGSSNNMGAARTPEAMAETVRQQILADPYMLRQLTSSNPELANAAMNEPAKFKDLYLELENRRRDMEARQREQMNALASADPFDIDAQRRIEEEIQRQNIEQNYENAVEYHPESFGRVVMLYIDAEVNGKKVKAFVDSGAQATILTPELAENCGIMHLLDRRYAGIAQGVGTAKILGRVHSATMKIGSEFLQCSFTIMEGKGVDLLFGLDMLKRHQAIIDLDKNVLRIHGQEVRFLSEHELPAKARWEEGEEAKSPLEGGSAAQGAIHPATSLHPAVPPGGLSQPVLGPAAVSTPAPPSSSGTSGVGAARPTAHSEEKIKMLVDLGIARQEAIAALDITGGDADSAAGMLFH